MRQPEDVFTLTVPGQPVPYARAAGGMTRGRFTPEKQRFQMDMIRDMAALKMRGKPLLDGPLEIVISAVFNIPASWSNKKKIEALNGKVPHTAKPDLSNLIKLVEDALNKVVFDDDSQITGVAAVKRYGLGAETIVTVRRLV